MCDRLIRAAVSCGLVLICSSISRYSFGQRPKPTLVCSQSTFVALKPRPELSYPCDGQSNEWDEKILKLPARVAVIKTLISQLSSFSDASWWAADTFDLSVCDFTHEPAVLTAEQRQGFLGGDYLFWLFGNDHIRLMLIPDPCYQTQYGGTNAFLLYRSGGRVFVTQVLDGYFSRAENPISVAFAKFAAQEIIEISTGTGGLNPYLTNYYFVIDPRSRQAVPRNLFNGDHGPTNVITSAMLFGDSAGTAPLK